MTLIIIEKDGSQSVVNCITSYLYPDECKKYHQGPMGCNTDCPHFNQETKEYCSFCEKETVWKVSKNYKPKRYHFFMYCNELEKPKSFFELLVQGGLISKEMEEWIIKLIKTNNTARQEIEIISEDNIKDAFHNISQNIIDLAHLIQKKVRGE